ncbi:MAG: hypothetical protein AABX47_09720 [Nanoarchaeota archaeon]
MAETSIFIDFMGDSPTVRVMDFLLTERDMDFSITDMADNSGVGRATLYRIWDSLIRNQVIIHTRDIGRARLFKLNKADPRIKKLIELDDMLVKSDLGQRAKKQVVKITV